MVFRSTRLIGALLARDFLFMVVVSPEECAVSADYDSKNRASRRIRHVAVWFLFRSLWPGLTYHVVITHCERWRNPARTVAPAAPVGLCPRRSR
jgi:hypothetical protein